MTINTAIRIFIGLTTLHSLLLSASAVNSTSVGSVGASVAPLKVFHPLPESIFIPSETFTASGWMISMLPAGYETIDSSKTGVVLLKKRDPVYTELYSYWRWTAGKMERIEKTDYYPNAAERSVYLNDRGEIAAGSHYPPVTFYWYSLIKGWSPSAKSFDFLWKCPVEFSRVEYDSEWGEREGYDLGYAIASLVGLDNSGRFWIHRETKDGWMLETVDRSGSVQRQSSRLQWSFNENEFFVSKEGGHWFYSPGDYYFGSIIDNVDVPFFVARSINKNGIAVAWNYWNRDSLYSSIRYSDGSLTEGPYGQNSNWAVTWVDDQDRMMGIRIQETGNAIPCLFLRKADTNGTLLNPAEYEYVDFVPFGLANGWTTDHMIAPDTIAPQLGIAKRTLPNGSIEERAFLALPAPQLAVDANRDGTIKLASEDVSDTTTAEKPYRFWLNDDDDGLVDSSVNIPLFSYTEIEENDIDVAESRAPDNENDEGIDGKRDLEDLARLRIAIGELRSLVHIGETQDGEIKLGLKWKIASDTLAEERTPSIRLFITPDALGTNRYLFDERMAAAQILIDGTARFGRAVGVVDANVAKPFVLPDILFTFAAPDIQLLFEGVTRGRGELQLVVLKRNQSVFEEIGQGPSVHLELKRANQLCHRWTCGDGDSTPPEALRPDLGFAWLPSSANDLPDEERDLVLYVHGYNMSEYLKKRWIETTYKRLWHLGYKGHVGGFTWPTAQSAIQFANSEIIAWQSGAKLNELLVDLKNRGYRVHMLAHSLGNVVAAESLHIWREEGYTDALVRTYIASQAAIPAAVYNRFADTMPDVEKVPYTNLPRTTLPPDIYASYWKSGDSNLLPETWPNTNPSYSAKAFIQSAASRWANFYNRNDYALSGFYEIGNRLKPAKLANFVTGSLNNQYDYTSEGGFEKEFGTIVSVLPPIWLKLSSEPLAFPVDRYEIFSVAAPTWSLALGTIPTDGAFTSSTNLASATYGFGNEHLWHSGQFRSYYAVRWRYWNQLLIDSQLKSPE